MTLGMSAVVDQAKVSSSEDSNRVVVQGDPEVASLAVKSVGNRPIAKPFDATRFFEEAMEQVAERMSQALGKPVTWSASNRIVVDPRSSLQPTRYAWIES